MANGGKLSVYTREEAFAAGFRQRDLGTKLRRVLPGLYADPGSRPTFDQRTLAACIWAKGVASHSCAAVLWEMDGIDLAPIEVTVSLNRHPRHPLVKVHRDDLDRQTECTTVRDIPVTTAARTLIDIADQVSLLRLAQAMECAWRNGVCDPWEVTVQLEILGRRGRSGAKNLHRLCFDCQQRRRPLDSIKEVNLWWMLKDSGLPLPVPGFEFDDGYGHPMRLDFAYLKERVAIEVNGLKAHGPEQHQRDNFRRCRIGAGHWYLLEFTAEQLEDRDYVLGRIRDALKPAEPPKLIIDDSFFIPASAG